MATVTARLAVLGENSYGDQEKDANSLLLELEKGLRSAKVGEQCESIVRFPRLLEKYPFPIFINSAFLKLADVFRGGTNILRFQILRVAQQSEKHLDKILSVDEFVQRIFYVIHSNHAAARAITLRTLGSVARIISERKNVHHSILTSLDSHDAVERDAAIYAAQQFAAQSKSFALSSCNKLTDMISGLATPVEMKLKIIPIFQHMHHDTTTTQQVQSLCNDLLKTHPAQDFVMVTLHTLSQLAAKSLIDIPKQVLLLLDYLSTDPRMAVKVLVLKDLRLLAVKGPHMWTQANIQVLCEFIKENPYDSLKIGGLNVLTKLSDSVAIAKFQLDGIVEQCVTETCYHDNVSVASRGVSLATHIAIHAANGSGSSEALESASLAIECLLTVTCSLHGEQNQQALKCCLLCIVKLCAACPELTHRFVDAIVTALATVPAEFAIPLCECMSAISGNQNVRLHSLTQDLLQLLKKELADSGNHKLMVSLVTLLYQASVGEEITEAVQYTVGEVLEQVTCWDAYKLARQAARYGHHILAAHIFESLSMKVSSENFDYWLSALRSLSLGEACVLGVQSTSVPAFVKRVGNAINYYQKGLAALKAATMPGQQLTFQCQYVQLRIRLLQLYTQLVKACCSFQLSPPPAIATSLALTTGADIHRCEHVVQQLEKCGKQFDELSRSFGELYQTAFDADPVSLTNIHIIQQSCQVIIYILNTLLTKAQKPNTSVNVITSVTLPSKTVPLELQPWIETSEMVLTELKRVVAMETDLPLSHEHVEFIIESTLQFCKVPLGMPRYFYQRLQTTDIKLAISPQAKSAGESISIHYDTDLTLKVEGVVQHGGRAGKFRKVKDVLVSVRSAQISRAQMVNESKLQENPSNEIENKTEPHNEYFSTQFLLTFPVAGIHHVTIQVSVGDEEGCVWHTGPRHTLSVKSYDEAVQRQQQQQYAAQRQQQRAALANRDNFMTVS